MLRLFFNKFNIMYLYLHNNNEALDAYRVFKTKAEKQYRKQIKVVRSDRAKNMIGIRMDNPSVNLQSFMKSMVIV